VALCLFKHISIMATETSSLLAQPSAQPPKRSKLQAYWELTRLHKFPAGSDLVFWPCAWGVTMAAFYVALPPKELAILLVGYALGSTILHSAACILNDICDRDFDRQVERCKNRPIASGDISVLEASIFLILVTLPCLVMLSLTNQAALLVAIPGIIPLHALYPLMKRWTNWPQLWLGFAMNWGFIPGWVSVIGKVDWKFLGPMIVALASWTLVYDTIYACQDRKDDKKAGVKSTALLFGDWIKQILAAFATVVVAAFAFAGVRLHMTWPYWAVSVGFTAVHFAWQLIAVDLDNGLDCWSTFKSNGRLGFYIWVGIFASYYLKVVA
jgi:4-hydroxybenzoate polyprenyltransferase